MNWPELPQFVELDEMYRNLSEFEGFLQPSQAKECCAIHEACADAIVANEAYHPFYTPVPIPDYSLAPRAYTLLTPGLPDYRNHRGLVEREYLQSLDMSDSVAHFTYNAAMDFAAAMNLGRLARNPVAITSTRKEALSLVLDLAEQNVLVPDSNDEDLAEQALEQQEAIGIVTALRDEMPDEET